jgi:hypothetical protein
MHGSDMKKLFVLTMLVLLTAIGVSAQATPPAEPNTGDHIQFVTNYAFDGGAKGQAAVAILGVPITDRFSLLAVNMVAPKVGLNGITGHTIELEYARNLADLIKSKSSQVNPSRFTFAVSGGVGTIRDAQGEGNASFAFSAAGRFTIKVNDTVGFDLVNVRYWRSRIATFAGQVGGEAQVGVGFRFTF